MCESRPCFSVYHLIRGEKEEIGTPNGAPPFHTAVPGDASWAGSNWCEINFPVGYNDPERSLHPWISDIEEAGFLSVLEVITCFWPVSPPPQPSGTKIA